MTSLGFAATTTDVTPAAGLPMAGYIARGDAVAVGKHDALEVTVLWLGDVVWVTLDALCADSELATRIRAGVGAALGIPAANVLVCASHTHAGPAGWPDQLYPSGPAADDVLRARLVDAVTSAAAGLAGRQQPVEPAWVQVEVTGVGANRNDPDGPHDRTCGVLVLHGPDGIAGVLFDFACHPTVLDPGNLHWSADWPGVARRRIAAATGAPVGFLQGAAGDVSPRFVRRGRDFAEVDRLGGRLADRVLPAVLESSSLRLSTPVVARSTVQLPVRQLAAAATAVASGSADRIAQSKAEAGRLLERMMRVEQPADLDLPVTAVSAGDLAWLHLPVELFASLGERIARASPFPCTRVVGYTDGYAGYVADEAGHAAGTYEALISMFDPAAGDRLVDESVALLRSLSGGAR